MALAKINIARDRIEEIRDRFLDAYLHSFEFKGGFLDLMRDPVTELDKVREDLRGYQRRILQIQTAENIAINGSGMN
nr:expressed protein [Hymenolepis microstoma]